VDNQFWNEQYAAREYMWKSAPNQFVEQHLTELAPGTAIDLAAGEGRNAVWLAGRGWQVRAVDFSDVGLDKGRRLAADNNVEVDFICADALTWQPDDKVGLVLLSYLQLHQADRETAVRRGASWVGPGGTFFLIAHDKTNLANGHGGPQDLDLCYDLDETAALVENAGLKIQTAEVAKRTVQTDDGERTALDTLLIGTAS